MSIARPVTLADLRFGLAFCVPLSPPRAAKDRHKRHVASTPVSARSKGAGGARASVEGLFRTAVSPVDPSIALAASSHEAFCLKGITGRLSAAALLSRSYYPGFSESVRVLHTDKKC